VARGELLTAPGIGDAAGPLPAGAAVGGWGASPGAGVADELAAEAAAAALARFDKTKGAQTTCGTVTAGTASGAAAIPAGDGEAASASRASRHSSVGV
jgi:hypothetical protein